VADERPTEERKLATVLFADLVGSTALSGSQDPERTRVLLDRFYDVMTEEIQATLAEPVVAPSPSPSGGQSRIS
jgi:class 3 adenylate cyclase